ncbi:MAG: hypothetical protein WCH04_18230 [Gammaproteobacteria bacterium]
MKVFRNLDISINESEREFFVRRVEALLEDGWRRDLSAEEQAAQMVGIDKDYYFACEKSGDRQAALLALVPRDELTLSVVNIVPREVGRLSIDQYNRILKEFYDKYVLPVSRELELHVDITADQQTLENWISSDSADALRTFSATVNKSTALPIQLLLSHGIWCSSTRPAAPVAGTESTGRGIFRTSRPAEGSRTGTTLICLPKIRGQLLQAVVELCEKRI